MSISIIAPYDITLAAGLEFYPSAGSPLATRLAAGGGNYQTTILAESGLIAYLKMDGDFNDSKGTNHGTGYGGVQANGTAKYGTYSGNFDGTDDYVLLANESNFDFNVSSTFSLESYIKTSDTDSNNVIISKDTRWFLSAYNAVGGQTRLLLQLTDSGNYKYRYGNVNLSDNVYHHVVGTYDGSNTLAGIKLYVDGAEQTYTDGQSGALSSLLNDIPVRIGGRSDGLPFNGLIDETAIYSRTLSAAEVLFHYQQGYAATSPAATHKFSIPGASIADIVDCLNYLENSYGGTGSLSYGYQLNGGSLVSGQTLAQLKAAVRNATITVHTDSLIVYVSHVSNGLQQAESSIKMGGGLHVVDPAGGGFFSTLID